MPTKQKTSTSSGVKQDSYSFVEYLEKEAANLKARKGLRTKARLVAATASLLETKGYHGLTHSDVCAAAGIGTATFYQYFQNKTELCQHVLERFIERIPDPVPPESLGPEQDVSQVNDLYFYIYQATLNYLRAVQANAGLFKSLLYFSGETDALTQRWNQFTNDLYERFTRLTLRYYPNLDYRETLIRRHLVGGMLDEFTRNYMVYNGDELIQLCDNQFDSESSLVLFLSDLWYTTVTKTEPPANRLDWVTNRDPSMV